MKKLSIISTILYGPPPSYPPQAPATAQGPPPYGYPQPAPAAVPPPPMAVAPPPPGAPPPGAPPMYGGPPELDTLKKMNKLGGIFSLIIGIIGFALFGISMAFFLALGAIGGGYGMAMMGGIGLLSNVWYLLPGIFGIIGFMAYKKIDMLVDQRDYQTAKKKTLIWTILGFIFIWVLPGIFFLIAYLKFDDVMRATGMAPPVYPPPAAAPPPAPPPAPAPLPAYPPPAAYPPPGAPPQAPPPPY